MKSIDLLFASAVGGIVAVAVIALYLSMTKRRYSVPSGSIMGGVASIVGSVGGALVWWVLP